MSGYSRNKHFVFLILFIVVAILFPQVRLYTAAWFGNSESMMKISDDYSHMRKHENYSGLFYYSPAKALYWMRKAAHKGNLLAFVRIIQSLEYSNPHEVVYWLQHGCHLGVPWCAEELARAYSWGRFGLPFTSSMQFGKIHEYDNLAVELHQKEGTLNSHRCCLLPRSPWPRLWNHTVPTSRGMHTETLEIHPGITRALPPVDVVAEEENNQFLRKHIKSDAEHALKQLDEVVPMALKGDVRLMVTLAEGYQSLGERYERLGEVGEIHLSKAVEWYRKAGLAGDAESAMILAYAHREGILGLPKDTNQSEAWFKVWQRNMKAEMAPLINAKQVAP